MPLGLSRASYYRSKSTDGGESRENLLLIRLIDEEYTRHPFYGTRQFTRYLKRKGYQVNRKRVRRLMKLMCLRSVAPSPGTSKPHPEHKIYPYLLRGLPITYRNQVHSSDITYIRLAGGFVYLTAVIDWYSRYVLSWELSVTMDGEFCRSALEQSIRKFGAPEIFNTDQGSQFTSQDYVEVLKDNGCQISMDGKGRALDNVFVERLWRSLKYEEIYLNEYHSVVELKQALKRYFDLYNNERPHSSLGGKTPAQIYFDEQFFKQAA